MTASARVAFLVAIAVWLGGLPGCGLFLRAAPKESIVPEGGCVIPTQRCSDAFLVKARVNGKGPYLMLLDTGAGITALSEPVAREMAGSTAPTLMWVEGATGKNRTISRTVRIESLEAGGMTLRGFDALVMDLSGLDTSLGGRLDGVLGYPAFRDLLLTIDYPAGEARVSRGELTAGAPGTLEVVRRGEPKVPLTLGGRRIEAELDTGSGGELSLTSRVRVEYLVGPRAAGSSMAVGGPEARRVGRAAEDGEIAGVTLARPLVEAGAVVNLVGTEIMRHFVVSFDQRAGLVRMEYRGQGPIEFESVYGIGTVSAPENGTLRVTAVNAGSPAERAGIVVGDVIDAIDGVPITEVMCSRSERKMEEKPGPMVLTVRRGEERLEVPCQAEVMVP